MQNIKQWLSDLWTKSWTTFLGEVKIVGGLGMAIGAYAGHIANDPNVQTALSKFTLPAEVGLGLAVLGAITLISMEH